MSRLECNRVLLIDGDLRGPLFLDKWNERVEEDVAGNKNEMIGQLRISSYGIGRMRESVWCNGMM